MQYNINSGWGDKLVNLPFNPTGSVFVVGDSSTVNIDRIKQLFQGNPDGKITYHATLQAAIDLCSTSAGDHVYMLPGHTETIDTTGDVLLDVTGLTVEGLGQGDLTPLFNITSSSGKVQITQGDVTLKNVRIRPGAGSSGGVIGIELLSTEAAHNVTLDGIIWGPRSSVAANFDRLVGIGTNSSGSNYWDGLTIKNNIFEYYTSSITGTGIGFNIVVNQLNDVKFLNNIGSVVCSGAVWQSSGTNYGWIFKDNVIRNQIKHTVVAWDFNGAATYGILANNYFGSASTDQVADVMLDASYMAGIETYVAADQAEDRHGLVYPATVVS